MVNLVANAPPVAVYAGDSTSFYTYTFTTGTVGMNLTGWTWQAQWRKNVSVPEFIALDVDSSLASTGVISVSASPAATAAMDGPGVWDLQGTNGTQVKTWVAGVTTFTKDVTHA